VSVSVILPTSLRPTLIEDIAFDKATGGIFTGGWYKDLSVGFYGHADNVFGRHLTITGCTTSVHMTGGFETVRTYMNPLTRATC
jgi:hypothetical protein